MSKTNSITSHHPERHSHRADKMSGMGKERKRFYRNGSFKFVQKFATKKRRAFLNNEKFFDKI